MCRSTGSRARSAPCVAAEAGASGSGSGSPAGFSGVNNYVSNSSSSC